MLKINESFDKNLRFNIVNVSSDLVIGEVNDTDSDSPDTRCR
jgi:hypothetical protein